MHGTSACTFRTNNGGQGLGGTGQRRAVQGRLGQGGAGQGRLGQGMAGQVVARQGQGRAGQRCPQPAPGRERAWRLAHARAVQRVAAVWAVSAWRANKASVALGQRRQVTYYQWCIFHNYNPDAMITAYNLRYRSWTIKPCPTHIKTAG